VRRFGLHNAEATSLWRSVPIMSIHPTAQVADGAELGQDVEIGPFSVVGPLVRLGDRCRLGSHVVVEGDTVVGADTQIYSFAVLGEFPQDKKLRAAGDRYVGRLRIGERNSIREHATIHGGTPFGNGVTTIGNDNMFLIGSHVGHDSTVGNGAVFTNGAMAAGHTVIGDRVILGAMVGVHQFARIGEMAMVGAGSMLSHDAPPYALLQGDRARLIGVNLIGLKRNDVPDEHAAAIKRAFRMLFWRRGRLDERLAAVRQTELAQDPKVQKILKFVAETRRGVCMPRGRRVVFDESKADETA